MASRMFAIGDLVYCGAGKGRARLVCPASEASKTGCRGRQVSCIKTHEHLQCSPQITARQHPCADWTCSWCNLVLINKTHLREASRLPRVCIVYWIEVNLKNLKTTLINHTRLRTKGQSAGYPQAQIEGENI